MSLSVDLQDRLGDFALDVGFEAAGGVIGLFGPSGSGKSSVINALAGLRQPARGKIRLDDAVLFDKASGVHLPPHKRQIGVVFQDARLFPHLTVEGNLRYGARPGPVAFDDAVTLLGLEALLARRSAALSGGERQRVAFGRALLSQPKLLLLDEPLAALDRARREEILPYLQRLRDAAGVPMVYVSHDLGEMARLATTLVLMREGQSIATGPARDLLADPALLPAFGLHVAGSLLRGTVARHADDGLTEVSLAGGALHLPQLDYPPGTRLHLQIKASDIILSMVPPDGLSALNVLAGDVIDIRPGAGPGAAVVLQVGDERLLARITQRSLAKLGLGQGQRAYAIIKSTAIGAMSIAGD